MGRSEFSHVYYDLVDLLILDPNLGHLEASLTMEEIDAAIADLPNNKSPGPDGFNGEFLKKC
jgi:hypothetical protein